MRHALALLALAACAHADDLVCWRITADPAAISAETAKKPLDTFGTNDWGMAVAGPGGVVGCVPVEDGGSTFVEVEPSAALTAFLVDIDETGLERASDAVEMKNAAGEQSLSFPEGSTVRFRMERFEPDKDSGADVKPSGARTIRPGEVHRDRLSFGKRDRTDFWALDLDAPSWVVAVVLPGESAFGVEWWEDGSTSSFDVRESAGGYVAYFEGRLGAGRRLLRLRARSNGADASYQLLFVTTPDKPARTESIADLLLDRARAGSDVWAFEEDEIAELLCRLDAPGVRERVVAALEDGVPEARRTALRVATQLRMDEAKARIGEMAASDPDWKTKGAAERALRDWDRKRR